jgi:hypothetical protein
LGVYEQCYSEDSGSCNRGQIYTAEFCFDAPERICFNHEFGCCTEYAPLFRTQRADGILGLSSDLMHKLNRRYVTFMITQTRAQMFFELPDVHVRWTRPIVRVGRSEIPVLFDTHSSATFIPKRLNAHADIVKCTEDQDEYRLKLIGASLRIRTRAVASSRCSGMYVWDENKVRIGTNAFMYNVIVLDHENHLVGLARQNDFWP